MMNTTTGNANGNIDEDIYSENTLDRKINEIKENSLKSISPVILIKPAIFSFIVLCSCK